MDKLILDLIKRSREMNIRIQDIERRVKLLEDRVDELGSIGVL